MNYRRKLVIGLGTGAIAVSSACFAQQQGKVWRIAYVGPTRAVTMATNIAAFKDGMRENGMIEGENYVLDEVYADGHYDRFPALVNEVMKRNPAIILTNTIASVRAAQQATKTVAIVFLANDPVGSGLVASLARPGGNTTGLSSQNEDVVAKFVELLREMRPRTKQVAILINAGNPTGKTMLERAGATARGLGISTKTFEVTSPESFDAVFLSIVQYKPDGLLVPNDAVLNDQRDRIAAFGLKNRIPVVSSNSNYVESGALVSYGPITLDLNRRWANYVKKIIAGANPGDLPVEQPIKFELAVNMKTAKALGITIPQSVLLRAARVFE